MPKLVIIFFFQNVNTYNLALVIVIIVLQRRELHDKDENVVIAALQSICDLCHDPERGYEAVNLKIIDR